MKDFGGEDENIHQEEKNDIKFHADKKVHIAIFFECTISGSKS